MVYYILPMFIAFSVGALRNAREETPAETLDQRNRRVMLDHVENFWVKGVLEKSLHGAALLELGIKEDTQAVNYPWAIHRELTDEPIPAGKSMLEIFQETGMGRSLLILGAPGSGKTTMLLELARHLIQRARIEETEPIPVVFNLASWKERQSLGDWLAEQLNTVYSVPRKTALTWINENRMFLLLDGLDEVRSNRRETCVEAINEFRKQHGLTSLVLCCRVDEYFALKNKLKFEGAIRLQPLTSAQVSAYFERFGKSLAGIKQMLRKDKALRELAETPLNISIMTLAYKDARADYLLGLESVETRRKHLFDTYIHRMFERPTRTSNKSFTKEQTLGYLSWLARMMIRQDLITYQIEAMQPSWLEEKLLVRVYRLCVGLVVGLVFGLFGGLVFGLYLVSVGLVDGLDFGLVDGLVFGLVDGLVFGLVFGRSDRILMSDKLTWSWREAQRGLLFALVGGLVVALVGGLVSEQVEETNYPGQRLQRTLISGMMMTVMFGLFGGLAGGLVFGLLAGLAGGYGSLIQHHVLRAILVQRHRLPRQLILFLDHAVDLIFLRRVGGSYIFVHRLLMEHFAGIETK